LVAGGLAAISGVNSEVHADASLDRRYEDLRKRIAEIMEDENSVNPSVDNAPGAKGGGGDIGPMLVRLAWHCGGTYDKTTQTGGSDGATMRFKPESDHGGNAGLQHARALLEPLKKEFPEVSYADLYIFSGVVAIEEMGGPACPFRPGRSDAPGPSTMEADKRFSPDGRLPDGFRDDVPMEDHIRDIFYRQGFNDQEIVALSGAHALGRCHTDRSGFWGPWTYSPSTFSNEYFRLLEDDKWSLKKTHNGGPWTGPEQFENQKGDLMMLYSDMALVWDPRFRKYVKVYKANEEKFFSDFSKAWTKLTENGCKSLGSPIQKAVAQQASSKSWWSFLKFW
jgi:cytochrome c peroxidase